ncbi:hypothetical protein PR048_013547 [Dryococelus australis]|uniref:Reverse transcriptase Ty1/copia-type domain-containing protein n=1 Tax=Dryococelus australis TaxID=614101 RepID=A0ABQ9HSW9_9NEOP|nr:hypothetical protein PR048_013547 [Dryococelus australis]
MDFQDKKGGLKKSRLVAKGIQGDPANNVYAPVARLPTICLLISIAVSMKWEIRQLDVPTAFLNGYIKTLDGVKNEIGKVLKLKRSVYGLRSALRKWNERFHNFMNVWLIIWVDYMLLTGEKTEVENLIRLLKGEFEAKDLGVLSEFLGTMIVNNGDEVKISHKLNTPIINDFQVDTEEPNNPTEQLRKAGKRVHIYLHQTQDLCLTFIPSPDYKLVCYSDSDWPGDKLDRKSVSGYVLLHATMQFPEAEYISCATAACDLVYLQGVLQDLQSATSTPVHLTDNQITHWNDAEGCLQKSRNRWHRNSLLRPSSGGSCLEVGPGMTFYLAARHTCCTLVQVLAAVVGSTRAQTHFRCNIVSGSAAGKLVEARLGFVQQHALFARQLLAGSALLPAWIVVGELDAYLVQGGSISRTSAAIVCTMVFCPQPTHFAWERLFPALRLRQEHQGIPLSARDIRPFRVLRCANCTYPGHVAAVKIVGVVMKNSGAFAVAKEGMSMLLSTYFTVGKRRRLEDQRKRGASASALGPWQLGCVTILNSRVLRWGIVKPQALVWLEIIKSQPANQLAGARAPSSWTSGTRAAQYEMEKLICWRWPNDQGGEGDLEVLKNAKCSDPHC